MNTAEILKWLRTTDPKSLPYNIVGLGWGPKISNNEETDEYCLVFYVAEKKDLAQLAPEQIIPKHFNVSSQIQVLTDVQTNEIYYTLASLLPKISTNEPKPLQPTDFPNENDNEQINLANPNVTGFPPITAYQDCHTGPTEYNPPEPIASHRQKHRPLKGGISSIFSAGTDATLGLFVRDKKDGQVVALSNAHVYAASQQTSRLRFPYNRFVPGGKGPRAHSHVLQISAIQPALSSYNPYGQILDYTFLDDKNINKDCIGICKRSVVIGNESGDQIPTTWQFGTYLFLDTSCDAAILQLSSYNLLDQNSVNVLNFNQPGPYEFATDEEIDSLLDPTSLNYKAPVFRGGRTCGPVGYPGYSNSCELSVSEFVSPTWVSGYGPSWFIGSFLNCYLVRGNAIPGRGGDSGSAYFALLSSTIPSASAWKVIGLLFAGPSDLSFSIGCRITSIERDLGITSWDGSLPTLSSSRMVVELNTALSTVELSGRTFYQVGSQNSKNLWTELN